MSQVNLDAAHTTPQLTVVSPLHPPCSAWTFAFFWQASTQSPMLVCSVAFVQYRPSIRQAHYTHNRVHFSPLHKLAVFTFASWENHLLSVQSGSRGKDGLGLASWHANFTRHIFSTTYRLWHNGNAVVSWYCYIPQGGMFSPLSFGWLVS